MGCAELAGLLGAVGVRFGTVSKLELGGGLLGFSICKTRSGSSSSLGVSERLILGLSDLSLLLVNLGLLG